MVCDAVAAGAMTSKEVAAICGAGADCGRCRCTVRDIIESTLATGATTALRRLTLDVSRVGSH